MPTGPEILAVARNGFAESLFTAVRDVAPIVTVFEALPMLGTQYLSLAVTALPTANGFLHINEGMVASRGSLSMGQVNAFRMGLLVKEPKSSTDLWNAQNSSSLGAGLVDDWFTLQAKLRFKSEMINLEKQILNGQSNSAKGFIGLRQATSAALAANCLTMTQDPEDFGFARHALNAGGSTSSTASSIYSVWMDPMGACLRMGGPQGVEGFLSMGEVKTVLTSEVDPLDGLTKEQEYYYSTAEGYVGLAINGSSDGTARSFAQYSVRRAFNVTAQAGFTCTEALLDQLIASHPAGSKPNALFLSGRSLRQLQADRGTNSQVTVFMSPGDAVSRTMAHRTPLPVEHRGIPLIVSEQIGNTDAIETPA
jgi:hypothetical protein